MIYFSSDQNNHAANINIDRYELYAGISSQKNYDYLGSPGWYYFLSDQKK